MNFDLTCWSNDILCSAQKPFAAGCWRCGSYNTHKPAVLPMRTMVNASLCRFMWIPAFCTVLLAVTMQAQNFGRSIQLGDKLQRSAGTRPRAKLQSRLAEKTNRLAAINQTTSTATSVGPGEDELGAPSFGIEKPIELGQSTDLFTGMLGLSIPVMVPQGRAGIRPQIALEYHSTDQNGELGVGWSLTIPFIERETLFGLDYRANDYVLATGPTKQPLVHVKDEQYGMKIEGAFRRIKRILSPDSWEITDKQGTRLFFGTAWSSQQGQGAKIFRWYLDRVEDVHGNFVTLAYKKDDDGDVYIDQVEYTGNSRGLVAANCMRFQWEGRDDVATVYTTGVPVRISKRLKYIDVGTIANGCSSSVDSPLSRRYELLYELSPITYRDRLSSLTLWGKDANEKLPPVRFEYQGDANLSSGKWAGGPNANPALQCLVGDFNGDGRSDIACYSGREGNFWDVVLSDGDQWHRSPVPWQGPGPGVDFPVAKQCVVGDFNGDGKSDIACYSGHEGSSWAVALSTGVGWDTRPWAAGDHLGPDVRLPIASQCVSGDFDGDGKTDLACNTEQCDPSHCVWYVARSTGSKWEGSYWDNGPLVIPRYPNARTNVPVQDRCVVGDFNGDGKADVACLTDVKPMWSVSLSTGSGWVPAPLWTGPYSAFPIWKQCIVGDFNGDRKSDLACKAATWQIALSTGERWDNQDWGANPNLHDCVPGDYNGDGRTDLLCYTPVSAGGPRVGQLAQPTGSNWKMSPIDGGEVLETAFTHGKSCLTGDFTGDGKLDLACFLDDGWHIISNSQTAPDLLRSVTSASGSIHTFHYTFSTSYKNTQLPFPLATVDSVVTDDGRSGFTADGRNPSRRFFQYDSGVYNIAKREFRGFGHVGVLDVGDAYVEGKVSHYWFHQGEQQRRDNSNPDGLVGALYRVCIADNRKGKEFPIAGTTITYEPNSGVAPFYNPPSVVQTYTYAAMSTQCEAADYSRILTQTFVHDHAYGSLIRQSFHDSGSPDLDHHVTREYINNPAKWIVGLVTRETVYKGVDGRDSPDTKVSSTEFTYDDADSNCNSVNKGAISHGDLTQVTRWLKATEQYSPHTLIGYDVYGNISCRRDPNGNVERIAYDASRIYPTTITDALNHRPLRIAYYGVDGADIDGGLLGQLKSIENNNGARTSFTYDAFGRRSQVTFADGSWIRAQYAIGDPQVQYTLLESAAGLSVKKYIDGLQREWRREYSGPDDTLMVTDRLYNSAGQIAQLSLPYLNTQQSARMSTLTYDVLGRLTSITRPNNTTQTYCYDDWSVSEIDENNHLKRVTVDGFGHISRAEEYVGTFPKDCAELQLQPPYAVTQWGYDVIGRLVSVRDAKGNLRSVDRDSLGRVVNFVDPDRGTTSYIYDMNGNVLTRQDSKGQTTTYEYDALNRLVHKTLISPGTKNVDYVFTYDKCNNGIPFLCSTTDPAGEVLYTYNALGQLETYTRRTKNKRAYQLAFLYDAIGRIASIKYPNERSMTYTYNGPFVGAIQSGASRLYEGSRFDVAGRPEHARFGNGVTSSYASYTYQSKECPGDSLLLCRSRLKLPNGGVISDEHFEYDAKGNLCKISSKSGDRSFAYDELDRLIVALEGPSSHAGCSDHQIASNGAGVGEHSSLHYRYDEIGNMVFNSAVGKYVYGRNHPHGVERAGAKLYSYDANGNMQSGAGRVFTTNVENEITRIVTRRHVGGPFWIFFPRHLTTDIAYNAEGIPTLKTEERALPLLLSRIIPRHKTLYVSRFVVCPGRRCDNIVLAGDRKIAIMDAKGKRAVYLFVDQVNSVRVVTDTGARHVRTYQYRPFGVMAYGKSHPRYGFTAQEFDERPGLYLYEWRYYDPDLARFILPDTYDGAAGFPQSLNRYSYVRNNPETMFDPSGHADEIVGWREVGHGAGKIGVLVGVMVLGAALAPETGGASLIVTESAMSQILAAFAISGTVYDFTSGAAEIAVGLAGVVSGQHANRRDVQEALSTASGWGALTGEIYSSLKGGNYEQRQLAREVGETAELGIDFARFSGSVVSAGIKGTLPNTESVVDAAKSLGNYGGKTALDHFFEHESSDKSIPEKLTGEQPNVSVTGGEVDEMTLEFFHEGEARPDTSKEENGTDKEVEPQNTFCCVRQPD